MAKKITLWRLMELTDEVAYEHVFAKNWDAGKSVDADFWEEIGGKPVWNQFSTGTLVSINQLYWKRRNLYHSMKEFGFQCPHPRSEPSLDQATARDFRDTMPTPEELMNGHKRI